MTKVNQIRQFGFTMLELMISLFVGAFILAGVMFTYLGMKVTTADTMDIGELQESGRLAMEVLKRDIELAGFWGNFVETPDAAVLTAANPTPPSPDCFNGVNNSTYPQIGVNEPFKVIFAKEAEGTNELNCVGSPLTGSDIIQIKRVAGQEITGITSTANTYFLARVQNARFLKGTGGVVNPGINAKLWEYIHNVYFIQEQNYTLNGQTVNVPTLRRMRLINGEMQVETVMEGVENMRFLFGLDTNNDARVDTYKTSSQMSATDWNQQTAVVTNVQIFLLVRTLSEDRNNPPQSQTFILGGEGENQRTITRNDGFRRKLLTSTVRLINVGSDQWAI
ncbi:MULTISPECIES: PilW family protein [Pseudoalteromonas]|uniref:PilW family protein n=1 Tax=Pseudoalteromonas spongiae TaxID=298657 RepID=A0ABU8EPN2_9GAMM|nr:PilW family protein [Pseudoalteromonas sp. T1lg24]